MNLPSPTAGHGRAHTHLLFALVALLVSVAHADDYTVTVDLNSPGNAPKYGALGSLFGASSVAGGPSDKSVFSQLQPIVSQSQGRPGENGSNVYSTEAVAPIIRGTGARMICRFNDLCYGWAPYDWPGYDTWMSRVVSATNAIKTSYKDVVLCVAPLNEPDNKLNSTAFNSDPKLIGSTYDARINYLWTQTVKQIKSIDPTIQVMGPNYENYRPWEDAAEQTRMDNFLNNAKATGTVPNIIGWHSLGPSPGDVPAAYTNYYLPLESKYALGHKPLCVEEYGDNGGDFEGVPGTMLKHIAAFERVGVDYGCTGIYTHNGTMSNTLRYNAWTNNFKRNGGWYLLSWYRGLTGKLVPVTRTPNVYQALDGVATYDSAISKAVLLLGGSNDTANLRFLGASAKFGTTVHVKVEQTIWDQNTTEYDREHLPEAISQEIGGDPKDGTFIILDKNIATQTDGSLALKLPRLSRLNGYRIALWPSSGPSATTLKYEAESVPATARPNTVLHNGPDAALASNDAYVGGIDLATSYVRFTVNVPTRGIYILQARYANGGTGTATHNVTVGAAAQGALSYAPTGGWSNTTMDFATKRVALEAGTSTITLAKGTGNAELDYIQLYPDTHRYEAEYAVKSGGNWSKFNYAVIPTYVGGINNATDHVEFSIDAPSTGNYQLRVAYANGGAASTHRVFVNGTEVSAISYPATGGWFSSPDPRTVTGNAFTTLALNVGRNTVRLQKGTNYAELDYVALEMNGATTSFTRKILSSSAPKS